MNRKHSPAVTFIVSVFFLSGSSTAEEKTIEKTVVNKTIRGSYEMNVVLSGRSDAPRATVFFAGGPGSGPRASLVLSPSAVLVRREAGDDTSALKQFDGPGVLPWKIRVLKKGNFFRFWVNGKTGWIRGPLGEWENIFEPWDNNVAVETSAGVRVETATVTTLPWLSQRSRQLWENGPPGSWWESGSIPGAIIEYGGKYYIYFLAHRRNPAGGEGEAAALRSIGVANSDDLRNWTVHPEPLITADNLPGDNVYPNAALILPDGRIALLFAVQKMPEWLGFYLAIAKTPLGPFTMHEKNPVHKHFSHAHEFDVVKVEHPDYNYLMLYSGFTPSPPSGPVGDRGYAAYSKDLVTWTMDPRNPVFSPETLDNWDAVHIRPRSLTQLGGTWYLWYEGCNRWTPPKPHHGWWDTVGLARSKDLVKWEYYPRNPALPALGIGPEQFDAGWVGWPRMVVKDGIGYVFYSGPGLRTIEIEKLTNWDTEGGETIDLLP